MVLIQHLFIISPWRGDFHFYVVIGQNIYLLKYILDNYFISNVFLRISGSRVGSEEAFFLYTSGPDLTSIMPCKYGNPSGTFSKFVTQEGLKCEHVRELLMKSKDVDTTALVVSLCFRVAL